MSVPARDAEPPVPCDKMQLIGWLNAHFDARISPAASMLLIRKWAERRYGAICPRPHPSVERAPGAWPTDVWIFVLDQEARSGE